jgi:ABC-type Na+ efflux pump permease subunit
MAMVVFRKDWREVSRNWEVMLPMVVIPVIFSVLLPIVLGVIPNLMNMPGSSNDLEDLIGNLPSSVRSIDRSTNSQG